jgi:CheY-like chemotaxis protein
MHGGKISVRSDGPGRGSEFTIQIPCHVEPALPPEPPKKAKLPPRKPSSRRILLVDDNVDAAKTLAMLLRYQGQQVTIVHDGVAALEAVAHNKPDLILLDIGLPRMDGYEVARQIREQRDYDDVVLIALTGWGQEEDRRRSREAGFNEHLTKPVDQKTLQRILMDLPPKQTGPEPDVNTPKSAPAGLRH